MKKYLSDYIEEIDSKIKDKDTNFKELEKSHLIKINFFQHERLIHLLVTLFYALFMMISIYISHTDVLFLIITVIIIIFLVFYVKHYFFLENGVQYLYKQYDIIHSKNIK